LKAIETFRTGRVDWCDALRTIAAAAPASTVVTSLSGDAAVEAKSKSDTSSSKKQLIINFMTPMSEDGSLPSELNGFLSILRGAPALKRNFPLIEVSGLQSNPAKQGGHPYTSYSIICLPKIESTPKAEPTKKAVATR
jgi:hypothetical protein